jgi:hypothetical protein
VDVCDDLPDVGVGETLSRHWRTRHSVLEDVERLRIGNPDIHAITRHNRGSNFSTAAAPAMTRGALLVVQIFTF